MMTKLGSMGMLAAMMIAMGSAACAEPPVTELGGAKQSSTADDSDDNEPKTKAKKVRSDDDAEEESPEIDATPAKKTGDDDDDSTDSAKPELAIDISFAASAGQKFGNVPIVRACSDMGADYNQATVADGTKMQLVDVNTKKQLLEVSGADFDAIKKELVSGSGKLHLPVAAGVLPEKATEYAIIIGGDSRFGSPAACGVDIAPHSEQDRGIKGSAGQFPTGRTIVFTRAVSGSGCGIVGFLQAYETNGQVYAIPTSPIVIAGDDEGRAGFPEGSSYTGCDQHASPLVLDLGGNGVALSKARSDVFDIDGNGSRDAMSWVSSNDTPFLVRDANGNGVVDGATELFGNHTDQTSQNGFEALSHFDDVADGTIDSHDKVWSTLRLWFDRNHDGRTDAGELETLESRGITSLSTGYVSTSEKLMSGNTFEGSIRQRGAATMSDGRIVPVVDVWFERKF